MRVGVIGGAGYTAGELLRLLVNHPAAEIAFVHSDSNAGNALGDVHGGLLGETDLRFTAEYDLGAIDVLFLCSAHGRSREFLAANALPEGLRIVDLAQDFRDESEGFVYGLPELNRDRIRAARARGQSRLLRHGDPAGAAAAGRVRDCCGRRCTRRPSRVRRARA